MKVLINITSYNRLEMLNNLIEQVKDYNYAIWDDNSDFEQLENMCRFEKNYGKKEAWIKWNKIFQINKKLYCKDFDYFIFLPDDVVLCDNFVEKAVKLWEGIKDEKKICMSFTNPERLKVPCFTAYEPEDLGNVVKTQWNDMMFICGKEFINTVVVDPIKESRWDKNPNLSSGVGSKISHLYYGRRNMYHAKEEMAKHIGNDCSLMNPEERKVNKL
jgi:hypothetical protein